MHNIALPANLLNDAPDGAARPRRVIPWRRLWVLIRPGRRALFAMLGLSGAGSLIGVLPPLALGALVNSLTAGHRGRAVIFAAVIAAAVLVEATAYAVSDGLYGVTTGRLFRDIRLLMLKGALRQPPVGVEATSGLSSRFVSDAETLEQLTVATLDLGAVGLFELGAALVALGVLRPWSVAVVGAVIVLAALVARRTQAPVAAAGEDRQEALEGMSRTLAAALAERNDPVRAQRRFHVAATRVLKTDIRLAWLHAANYHGSGALAGLGPLGVVVVAAFQGGFKAGTLLSLYLLAERAFIGADSLLDLKLDVEVVRGAVSRCFEVIDTPALESLPATAPRHDISS